MRINKSVRKLAGKDIFTSTIIDELSQIVSFPDINGKWGFWIS